MGCCPIAPTMFRVVMHFSITVWSFQCSDGLCRAFIFKHPSIKQAAEDYCNKHQVLLASGFPKSRVGVLQFPTCSSVFGIGMGCLHPGAGACSRQHMAHPGLPSRHGGSKHWCWELFFFPYVFTALCSFKDSLIFLFQFRPLR